MRIRQTLNIESGLNDGIALPFLLAALSIASSEALYRTPFHFFLGLGMQVSMGILAGIAIGYLGGKFLQLGQRIGWMSRAFQKISALVLILIAYTLAELVGGNGFISAFTFGIVFSRIELEEFDELHEYIEVEIAILMLLTYLLFGAVMLPAAAQAIGPDLILYAGLSLTLVRMIPVAISLVGAKLHPITTLFIGWFGPRGIASILYIFLVLEVESLPGFELIYVAAMITVFFSILAHGMTAAPGASAYGKRIAFMEVEEKVLMERKQIPEFPLRIASEQVRDSEID